MSQHASRLDLSSCMRACVRMCALRAHMCLLMDMRGRAATTRTPHRHASGCCVGCASLRVCGRGSCVLCYGGRTARTTRHTLSPLLQRDPTQCTTLQSEQHSAPRCNQSNTVHHVARRSDALEGRRGQRVSQPYTVAHQHCRPECLERSSIPLSTQNALAGVRWTLLADPQYHSFSEWHYCRERSSACVRGRTRAPTRAHTGACMHTEARIAMRMLQAGTTAREMAMDKIGSHTVEIIVKSAPSEIFLLLCGPSRYVLACARACVRVGYQCGREAADFRAFR